MEQPIATRRTVLRGLAAGAAAYMITDADAGQSAASPPRPRKLPRTDPGSVGVDPAAVLAFVDAVEKKVGGLHSFILVRHGRVAAEGWWSPYAPQHPHMLFSLSKSFTSTAVGLAVSEGRLTVDAPVTSLFPDDLPAKVSENLAAMRVRHLLSMSTGHDKDATGPAVSDSGGNWARGFLSVPVEHKPGTHFVYNSAATYMLSAIVQKLTGTTVLDYLTPRLFGPLGIEGATWEKCPRGINTGGWGLSVKTEDIARFGQLYLQRGQWNRRQLVPAKWIAEATTKQIPNGEDPKSDWAQGYCYQFWRCRHGAYRGDGAFGQYCVVMPEQDAILAITSGVGDMQAALNVVWDHLLPGMRQDPITQSDSADDLKRRLGRLSVTAPEGKPDSPVAKTASGKTYQLEPNEEKLESVALKCRGSRVRVTFRGSRGEHSFDCAGDSWVKGEIPSRPGSGPIDTEARDKIAARGAWTAPDTYTIKLCFYETPFEQTMAWKFDGDRLTLTRRMNVGFGPTELPTVIGRAISAVPPRQTPTIRP